MQWPLGNREDLYTEFKRVDALRDPANVAREVVGFLNAEGGQVWIGFGETDGVADLVEPVSEPDRQRDRLRDALVDLIEPAPMIGREVEINFVPFPADPSRGVLVVDVKKGQRGPYALLRQTARAFLQRTGSRLRPLTREELWLAFTRAPKLEGQEAERVRDLEADMVKWSATFAGLKVAVRPVGDMELRLDSESLSPLLQDARKTDNRPLGWNFTSRYSELKPLQQGYRFGEKDSVQWLEIRGSGEIEFSAGLERLLWKGDSRSIWPFALLEMPTSVLRLARTLYTEFANTPRSPDARIVLGLGIFGIRDWTLAPYSPNSIGYQFPHSKPSAFDEADDFFGEPVVELWKELEASPDKSAYKLIRQVYRAFHYEEKAIPAEYNRATGQLAFPG
ncbi:MAG: hypothetical protein NVS2B6_17350 [Thermoleophilaceae bacterium]